MNTKNLCHFCTGTSPAAGETYFDECDNCRARAPLGKPDYSHIARDTAVRIQVTAEQMSAVLFAYDYGIDQLDEDSRYALDAVIANLKDSLHP